VDKKRIVTVTGALILAGAPRLLHVPVAPVASAAHPTASARWHTASPDERFTVLPRREPIGEPRGEPFEARSWASAPPPATAVAPPRPTAPPVPYRVAGQVSHAGVTQVVLARENRIMTVREGERLDDTYLVESIKPDEVTLIYLPLDERQSIPVSGLRLEPVPALHVAVAGGTSSTPAASAAQDTPAVQLRWEGPEQVQAGSLFDVRLKVSSAQPLGTLPLQLIYDAQLLERIAVRPGELFANASFTSKVNPAGSISVGASANGAVPADSDLLIMTFRPRRSGDAELRLSPAVLQGAPRHEAPPAFRTAIVE
jgi:hypothetical protein